MADKPMFDDSPRFIMDIENAKYPDVSFWACRVALCRVGQNEESVGTCLFLKKYIRINGKLSGWQLIS